MKDADGSVCLDGTETVCGKVMGVKLRVEWKYLLLICGITIVVDVKKTVLDGVVEGNAD